MNIACKQCGKDNRFPVSRLGQAGRCGACKAPLDVSHEPIALHSESDFQEVLKANIPVLVDFWAPWCGPCRMVAPELEKIARSHAGRVLVAKLNTDEVPSVAQQFQIRSIPTMTLFVDGAPARTLQGARPAEQIVRELSL